MIINKIFYINILVFKSINIQGIKFVPNKARVINSRDTLAMKKIEQLIVFGVK
jgi:hypothetical protein